MAWAHNDQYELAVMTPLGGEPIVAWINPDGPVAVQAPTPLATLVGGRIELRWPAPADVGDGCHVYRAIGGAETRLTPSPLQPAGQAFVFVDDLDGLAGGVTVAYSYAIVRGGPEIARSPAAAVELPGGGGAGHGPAAEPAQSVQSRDRDPLHPGRRRQRAPGRVRRDRPPDRGARGRRARRGPPPRHLARPGRRRPAVPSGSYYVRLETGTTRDTRKIMLLK